MSASEEIERVLPTAGLYGSLGRPRLHLRCVDSTNERARMLARSGAPSGALVTADEQTAGRGRQGRRWFAPPRSALLMSAILRFDSGARVPALTSLAAAVAVCDVAGSEALVKWPNDVVLRRDGQLAKLAGILIEGRPQEGWLVVGIGLNVAVDRASLPAELATTAASLGLDSDAIEPLLARLLLALESRLGMRATELLDAWRSRDALRGSCVKWDRGDGLAAGVDTQGRLLVERDDGSRVALDSGEVHLLN